MRIHRRSSAFIGGSILLLLSVVRLDAALEINNGVGPTGITTIAADLTCNLVSTNTTNAAVTIYYGETDGTNVADSWAYTNTTIGTVTTGAYSVAVSNLTPTTLYFYRAYAEESTSVVAWASISTSFWTRAGAPTSPPTIAPRPRAMMVLSNGTIVVPAGSVGMTDTVFTTTGGTNDMTGSVTKVAAPTADDHAATKKYTDDEIAGHTNTLAEVLAKSGDGGGGTATNFIIGTAVTVPIVPEGTSSPASKQYVDDEVGEHTNTFAEVLAESGDGGGGTATNFIIGTAVTVPITPEATNSPTSKQYVDDHTSTNTFAEILAEGNDAGGHSFSNLNDAALTNLTAVGDVDLTSAVTKVATPVFDDDAVTKNYADRVLGTFSTLWFMADYTLTNDVSGLAPTTTTVIVTAATNEQHVFFWSGTGDVDFVEDNTFHVDLFAESTRATVVGLQVELYHTNAAQGRVEIAAGPVVYFLLSGVETPFRLDILNAVGTNLPAASAFGVAIVIHTSGAPPPNITLYLEGLQKSRISVPVGAAADVYLPRDGHEQMLGALQMGSNPITGAGAIDAESFTGDHVGDGSALTGIPDSVTFFLYAPTNNEPWTWTKFDWNCTMTNTETQAQGYTGTVDIGRKEWYEVDSAAVVVNSNLQAKAAGFRDSTFADASYTNSQDIGIRWRDISAVSPTNTLKCTIQVVR